MTTQTADWWARRGYIGGLAGADDGGDNTIGIISPPLLATGLGAASQPTAGLAAGTYDRAMTQAITLSTSSAGASIYYTTDGSTPTTGSTLYTGAIAADATTTIKALASGGGFTDSTVFSGTYTIIAPQLYVPGNGFNTGTSIVDASGYARAITVAGNAQFSTATAIQSTGSSILLDGTGDYFSLASDAAWNLGSSDYVIRLRIKTTQTRQYATIFSKGSAGFGAGSYSLMMNHASSSAGDLAFYAADYSAGAPLMTTSGVNIRDGSEHEILLVRVGSAHAIYVDGVSRATATSSFTYSTLNNTLYFGTDVNFSPRDLSANLGGIWWHKGTGIGSTEAAAWYAANVPMAPHPNLLLHMDGTHGSTTFTDSSNSAFTVSVVNSAQLTTSSPKFGTASGLFGSSKVDALTLGGQSAFASGTADFTVRAWITPTATGVDIVFYDTRPSLGAGSYIVLYMKASGVLAFDGNGANRIVGTTVLTMGVTVLAEVSRKAGVTKLFLGGNQEGSSYADTNNYIVGASRPCIGHGYNTASGNSWYGKLDELEVYNGMALNAANYTVPSRPSVA